MRSQWELQRAQFVVLYRVFLRRAIDLELMAANADPTRLLSQFATIFIGASIALGFPVLMTGAHPLTLEGRWTGEHFFLETTMTLAGLIAVLNWDAAFPDKRDILVLAPLPVRTSTLLLAKIAALFAAPGMAILAFNLFCGVAWPLLFIHPGSGLLGVLRAWPAYWITIILASSFLVFTVLALQGLAANLLPRQLFLKLSALLQAATLCFLVCVYFLEPSLESPAALLAPENQRLLQWLPSYWFLGLFQQLNGSMHPALLPLARRAWMALALSALGTLAALLLAYFRTIPKTVEQPDILPSSLRLPSLPFLAGSLPSAVTLLSLRTLQRSRQHRMILSFYLGIGLALVIGYVRSGFVGATLLSSGIGIGFLLSTILMMILTVLALRVVASIPISLSANWIIRVTQVRPARAYRNAVRASWLLLGVLPVLLIVLGLSMIAAYPSLPAIKYLAALLCLGIALVELCLATFQKIPFTCSYLPGKANIHFAFWASLFFFLRILKDAAILESRMLNRPGGYLLMLLGLICCAAAVHWSTRLRRKANEDLLWEEEFPAEIISLHLS